MQRTQRAASGKNALDKLSEAAERRNHKDAAKPQRAVQGVLIAGLDNCLVKFARCCMPVPGDDIVGFITRGYGVSVHRSDCQNHISSRVNPGEDSGRWIEAEWADETPANYQTMLTVNSRDRGGLVMDVATVLNALNARVRSLNARDMGEGRACINLLLEVKDLAELTAIINRLNAIQGVSEVVRSSG